MGSRTMPTECPHGRILDWGDFGPSSGNEYDEPEGCAECDAGNVDRILWNNREENDIDEIVIHDCTVHVEQMHDRCWWIGITKADGTGWMGNFTCDSRGRMSFSEQDNEGIKWRDDDAHKAAI